MVIPMPGFPEITDAKDPRLAGFEDLQRVEHPLRAGLCVVEGAEPVRWALLAGYAQLVAGRHSAMNLLAEDIHGRAEGLVVAGPVMSAVCGFPVKRSIMALCRRPPLGDLEGFLDQQTMSKGLRLLVLDAVHDPANVGAMIRSARCLGVQACLLLPGCADPFYRRSIRVSVGHAFTLPILCSDQGPAAMAALRRAGVHTLAAHRGPGDVPLETLGAVGDRWALVLGNEDRGVTPEVVGAVDGRVAITMEPGVDSLNVAIAGGILLHHLCRMHGRIQT